MPAGKRQRVSGSSYFLLTAVLHLNAVLHLIAVIILSILYFVKVIISWSLSLIKVIKATVLISANLFGSVSDKRQTRPYLSLSATFTLLPVVATQTQQSVLCNLTCIKYWWKQLINISEQKSSIYKQNESCKWRNNAVKTQTTKRLVTELKNTEL